MLVSIEEKHLLVKKFTDTFLYLPLVVGYYNKASHRYW